MQYQTIKPGGPYHDFWQLSRVTRGLCDYHDLVARKDAPVRFPDDLLIYFHDILSWIPTKNPAKAAIDGHGLNYYGPTIIIGAGAGKFADVCQSLATLYSHGPKTILLSGGSAVELDEKEEPIDDGYLLQYVVEQDWLVQTFATLSRFGQEALDETHFILHLGV